MINFNTYLTHINLKNNSVSNRCGRTFIEAIKHLGGNLALTSVNLDLNPIDFRVK